MLTLLGLQARYFPFPPWCDRQRVSVVPDDVPIVGPLVDVQNDHSFSSVSDSLLLTFSFVCRLIQIDLF
jgi:hypothetical protein